MLEKVAFTMYPARDVPAARRFYEEILGLEPGSIGTNRNTGWWVEYDLPGGGCFAITNFIEDRPSGAAGGTIAFEVADLDTLVKDLEEQGVTFESDVIHSPVCRMAVCLDPEGNSIVLHELKNK